MPRTSTRDVQPDVWRLEPVDGETDWFNMTAIARQLGKMLLHYNNMCSVASSVGSVVIEGRATPHIEPEDWQDGLATVTMKLTGIPIPSSQAVITVSEVDEPAHQGQTTVLLKVPEHTRSAWRMVYGNVLAEYVYSDSHPWDETHQRILYERHTPERWYSVLNATRNKAGGSTYYSIPSGYYGMEFGYSIATAQGWYSPGYPLRYGRMVAREDWAAYVWDLQPYIGQNLNYLLEIGELQSAPESNAETWAPIVYKPGTPGWYEHDWNNTSQQPMPNWTISFRYDFWDVPRESWDTAYLWDLPSAHTTTLHSLIRLHLGHYFIQLPITTVPKRYLFFCPHIHLGSFPFHKPKLKDQLFVRLLRARSLRIWSA